MKNLSKNLEIFLIILLFMFYAYLVYYPESLMERFGFLENHLNNIKLVLLLISLTLLYLYIKNIINEKRGYKRGVKFYFTSILRLFYYFMIISSLFVYLGGSLEGLSTIIGLVGAGLAISLQKPILNFVGFLSILVNRVYSKGDSIELEGIRGIVYDINTMTTQLYEFDENGIEKDVIVSLPNSMVLDKKIKNFSKPIDKSSFSFVVSITYDSNLDKSIKKMKKIIDNAWADFYNSNLEEISSLGYSKILKNPDYKISTLFSTSSIDLTVTFKSPLLLSTKLRTTLINSLFNKLPEKDIEFAYPHMEILLKNKKS